MDLNEVLIEAAKDGNMLVLKAALEKGADINAKDKNGWTALMWASKNGHSEIADHLKENGAAITELGAIPVTEHKEELGDKPNPNWKIVFGRMGQGIMVMNADGTELRGVLKGGEMPSVSTDGNKIVFVSGLHFANQPLADVEALSYAGKLDKGYTVTRLPWGIERYIDAVPEIYLIDDIEQGTFNKLSLGGEIGVSFPKFSPDSRKIGFKGTKDRKCSIWVSDINSANLYQLSHGESVDYFCWMSNEKIFFSTENGEKYIINADGSKLERLTIFEKDDYEPLWDKNGKYVAFCNGSDLYIMDSDGYNRKRLTEIRGWIGSWSPDGQWLVFASRKMGENGTDIFIIRIDGKYEKRLTSEYVADGEIGGDFDPCWLC